MSRKLPPQAFGGIEYVRRYYGVPAKVGGRVRYTNRKGRTFTGTITSAAAPHLRVLIDGNHHPYTFHPTDLEYLEDS